MQPASSSAIPLPSDRNGAAPPARRPAALVASGWNDDDKKPYQQIREALAQRGWITRFVDLPGRNDKGIPPEQTSRADHLEELVAAYDALARMPEVERAAIAFIGFSYGAYLGALLSAQRPIASMALRAPALYRDEDWQVPKEELDKEEVARYRRGVRAPQENAALAACAAFRGDVLLVESGADHTVPHPALQSYRSAFRQARSMTYSVLQGADHALSSAPAQARFRQQLLRWIEDVAELSGSELRPVANLRAGHNGTPLSEP